MTGPDAELDDEGLLLIDGQWQAPQAVPLQGFDEFYAENYPILCKVISAVGQMRGIADAEDVVQDTFVLGYENWDRIGRLANPQGYLLRVARRLLARAAEKIYRQLSIQQWPDIVDLWTGGDPHSDHPHKTVAKDEVNRLLAQLPARQAQVMFLSFYDFTDREIGSLLELAPATVRSHRRHAHRKLYELLAERSAI